MGELSIEEKAKRYNKALKVLHKYDGANIMFSQSLKEEMFPELKESKNKRIRKSIICALKQYYIANTVFDGFSREDMIAWLEKQDEYTDIPDNAVLDSNEDGLIADTIRCKIEKQGEQKPVDKVEPKFKVGDIIRHKEQRCTCKITAVDTTTAEYGVSECSGTHLPFDFQDAWELVEQKPAEWSEEDREYMQSLLDIINGTSSLTPSEVKCHKDWLKSLKDRFTWKPSEEQFALLKHIIRNVPLSHRDKSAVWDLYLDLKRLELL